MIARLKTAFRLAIVTLLLTGVVYPLAVTGVSAVVFPRQSVGSFVTGEDGRAVGSELIGQAFESPEYFHSRPSAAGYDAMSSGGSNLGPTSAVLRDSVVERVNAARTLEGLAASTTVPVDMVTASASGLDPHITPASARVQAKRVAHARGMALEAVLALVEKHTEEPTLGIIGESRVNVLLLNLELDHASKR
ncbi:MAG: potassium-transporting ATPase subunit KdpC [Actinomycetota bacterium]|nr:potassium-transporting ATPase subunit KdpC [Actinomycetota bacterium]